MIYLQWYRDKDNGQQVADTVPGVVQVIDIWPVARLVCKDRHEADAQWEHLFKTYRLNATTFEIP